MKARKALLGLALVAAVGWSAWALYDTHDNSHDVVEAVVRSPASTAAAGAAEGANAARDRAIRSDRPAPAGNSASMELAVRPNAPARMTNVFSAYSYQPAARAQAAVAAAPAPRAPPLPFAFTGRIIYPDNATTYLLLQGETPIEVRVGSDVGEFKLVEASQAQLVFLHAPTGDRVPLQITSPAIN